MACRNSAAKNGIHTAILRCITVFCLASTLAVTFVTTWEVQIVAAADSSATTVRQDRRPDRERPVMTSSSSGSGDSQSSSTSNPSTPSRPRLVRR